MRNRGYIFLISILLVIGLMPVSLIKGETTPPTVDITSHTTNQTVHGDIIITATASDSGSGVDFVQFYFGGELISTDYSAPYASIQISVKHFAIGAQTIAVVAFDNDENWAVDTVIVNVVIYDDEYDWYDCDFEYQYYDSVIIWFTKYDMYMENIEAFVVVEYINEQYIGILRKVEFDWYSNDISSNVICKWTIYGISYGEPVYGSLSTPSTNPTHVTLTWGPTEFTDYYGHEWLHIGIEMYRYGNYILGIGLELMP